MENYSVDLEEDLLKTAEYNARQDDLAISEFYKQVKELHERKIIMDETFHKICAVLLGS